MLFVLLHSVIPCIATYRSVYVMYDSFFFLFFKITLNFITKIPLGISGHLTPGVRLQQPQDSRAVVPVPANVCSIFVPPKNGMVASGGGFSAGVHAYDYTD